MKIKEGFELRNVCGENVIMAHGIQNVDFTRIICMNETATYLWNNVIDKEFNAQNLADLLTDEYEVDAATALNDAKAMLSVWQENGLVE